MKHLILLILYLVVAPCFLKAQDIEEASPDPLFRTGMFFDWNPAFYILNEEEKIYNSQSKDYDAVANFIPCFGLTHKIGTKNYFWGNEKHRLGFQWTWIQGGFLLGGSDGSFYVSFGGFGLARIHKFTKHLGLETNFSIGPNFMIGDFFPYIGALIDADVKFRVGYLAVGFRLAYGIGFPSQSYHKPKMHTIEFALTVGAKF